MVERTSFSVAEVATRWGLSEMTIRRLVDSGDLKAINIGASQRIPRAEVERAELHGAGTPRPRKVKA